MPGPRLAQHLLASTRLAETLADDAGIQPTDRVLELGAGTGVLTGALARRAAHVLAVEIDHGFVRRLVSAFGDTPNVTVLATDLRHVVLPATPYRVVANLPFQHTAATLHRLLDDPTGALCRADLVVQWQVARARARAVEGATTDLRGATWGPWWTFTRGRRLPAKLFRPPPAVDAAVLTVTRRAVDSVDVGDARAYGEFVRDAFDRSRVDGLTGIAPSELSVDRWVARFERAHPPPRRRARRGTRPRAEKPTSGHGP